MAVLLDTSLLTPPDRVPAVVDAMRSTTAPCDVRFDDRPGGIFTRIEAWRIGDLDAWRNQATGMRMIRARKHVAQGFDGRVAIAVQERGQSRISYDDGTSISCARPGDLICVDLTKPYDYAWAERGAAFCVSVPHEQLGMGLDDLLAASQQIGASPLYGMFRRHLLGLARQTEAGLPQAASEPLGAATAELLRALLSSTAPAERAAATGLHETLFARIREHVRQNLHDVSLDPQAIAVAHNVSVRQLYRVCAAHDFSIEQTIIHARLDAAREQLRDPASAHLPIAAVARRWGFRDSAHFSRRFKEAFDMTPRDWRLAHRTARTGREH